MVSSPRAVLMLSLTLNPSLLSTERERELIYSQKSLLAVVVKIRFFLFFCGLITLLLSVSFTILVKDSY